MNEQKITTTVVNPARTPSGAPVPPPRPPHQGENHLVMWILIAVVILLMVVVFYFIFHRPKPNPPQLPPVSISVTNVRQGDIEEAVTALGSVQPVYTVAITPRVDGQVVSVNYTEGQLVNTNDLLAVIDPGPYQAMELEAEGQLARDQALLEGATIDLDRYKTAFQKNAIPKQQYDDQLALVHQDQGTVKYDQGLVSNAAVQLNYCYIRAPIAGRVGLRLVDPGNVVHAANTNALLMLAELQPITVVFNIAEDYLPEIQAQLSDDPPMTVEAYDRAQENKIATGSFLTLDNLIDTSTGTIRVKSVFTNEDMALFPNQFVNAKLIIQTLRDQNLIPTFAIQRNPEGAFVYLLTNASATNNGVVTNFTAVTMRNITTGTSDGTITAITQGLSPGDKIAVNNFNKLGENVRVVVRTPGHEGQVPGGKHGGGSYGKKVDASKESP